MVLWEEFMMGSFSGVGGVRVEAAFWGGGDREGTGGGRRNRIPLAVPGRGT